MSDFLPFTRPLITEDTIKGVVEVLRSGWITSGPQVQAFEDELTGYLGGNRFLVSYSHATGAMEECLRALGIGPGDEVIVPDMTFAATANVVLRVGAKPVLVDVDLVSRNFLPEDVEAAITARTRAIMPVHFAGLPVDLDAIYDVAERHRLRVIEDAAHAIGARYRKRLVGSFGDVVVFSFHANKNLTTIEGAAVSTADDDVAERLRLLRFHGQQKAEDGTHDILMPASKYNLSDVSARIGRDQLATLNDRNQRRGQLAKSYFQRLSSLCEFLGLPAAGDSGHAWHMFTVLFPFERMAMTRGDFVRAMRKRGIGVGCHYPALHQLTVYKAMGYEPTTFPNADRIGKETVTLPLFPEMEEADVDRVCDAINEIAHERR